LAIPAPYLKLSL